MRLGEKLWPPVPIVPSRLLHSAPACPVLWEYRTNELSFSYCARCVVVFPHTLGNQPALHILQWTPAECPPVQLSSDDTPYLETASDREHTQCHRTVPSLDANSKP
jgi:hypothetical protein